MMALELAKRVLCFMTVAVLGWESSVKIVATLKFILEILILRNVSYAAIPYLTNERNVLNTILTLVSYITL